MPIYAVVQTGGKQYKVATGRTIVVEKLSVEEGATVELSDVRLVVDGEEVAVGRPSLEGAKVVAEVVSQGKSKKVIVFKYKPKAHYRRKTGHRQPYTMLSIKEIVTAKRKGRS